MRNIVTHQKSDASARSFISSFKLMPPAIYWPSLPMDNINILFLQLPRILWGWACTEDNYVQIKLLIGVINLVAWPKGGFCFLNYTTVVQLVWQPHLLFPFIKTITGPSFNLTPYAAFEVSEWSVLRKEITAFSLWLFSQNSPS